jgi:hypothetical protein
MLRQLIAERDQSKKRKRFMVNGHREQGLLSRICKGRKEKGQGINGLFGVTKNGTGDSSVGPWLEA